MHPSIENIRRGLRQTAETLELEQAIQPRGVVRRVGDGVAMVSGLAEVGHEELVLFDSGAVGMAYDLLEDDTGVVLLTHPETVREGEGVWGQQRLPDIPVGPAVLGRLLDPLGNPLDEGQALPSHPRLPLFQPALEIVERKSVEETLWTGVMAIDAAIPIGRGQRELIIGDRNVGKTSLALDIVAAQKPDDVVCVYVVIGQPMSRVLLVHDILEQSGCLEHTVIIVGNASDPPGLQFLAPYAGTSVAESFRDQGRDALVIYDDLTKHADTYRELALLLNRPPGREAYPGDIFSIHAELLERAAARHDDLGGGSVTAFPLVETTDSDISAYIPTNLISITDGQIYLDTQRFERNQRPAIDIGRSVSRIGAIAQSPVMRSASKNLRIAMARFEALESLSRVGLDMDTGMQETLRRGRLVRELLRQGRLSPLSPAEQLLLLFGVREHWFRDVPLEQVRAFARELIARAHWEQEELLTSLSESKEAAEAALPRLAELLPQVRAAFDGAAS